MTPRLESSVGAAGAVGSVLAALCCAGVPAVVGVVTAMGLGFLIADAILLPALAVLLGLEIWHLARSRASHGSPGPLTLGLLGALSLTAGVFASPWLLAPGAGLLVAAWVWNVRARRRCGRSGFQGA